MRRFAALLVILLFTSGGGWSASAEVIINEVMANNDNIILPNNDVTDYIELHNPSATAMPLDRWRLTDTPTNLSKFLFPVGVSIPAGGYLLVYCDKETNSTGLHSGFGLDNDGSYVGLYTPEGVLSNSMTFGMQVSDHSVGRHPSAINYLGAANDFTLNLPTPGQSNILATLGDPGLLKINEWMALSVSAPGGNLKTNSDWLELYNPDTNIVALGGLVLSDASPVLPSLPALQKFSYIPPQGFVRIYADDKTNPANHVKFKISSTSGDDLYLLRADRSSEIDHVATTRLPADHINWSEGRLPDGTDTLVWFAPNRVSPDSSNFTPLTNSVVISEVLAHTDPPLEDAIEIFNPTAASINIGLWWISNEKQNQKKFQIPANTILPPGGFVVYYENDFSPHRTEVSPEFRLNSAHGDKVYLFTADANGELTGYFKSESFGASANGVSFGRYVTSEKKSDFVPMTRRSFGQDAPPDLVTFRRGTGTTNPLPLVGPLVINEIMYHPPDIMFPGNTNRYDDSTNEFIEILNIAPTDVFLFDPQHYGFADGRTNTGRLRGTVDFEFETGVSLAPNRSLVVVNFDPDQATNAARVALFRQKYDLPTTVRLFGPYRGKLSNTGGSVELLRADPPQDATHPDYRFVPYVITDQVQYGDKLPWPLAADGLGKSLQRLVSAAYGNDPANWLALAPSAGRLNPVSPPKITSQPKSQTVVAGSSALFEVAVSGAQPLEYQWNFNGAPVNGQTNSTLSFIALAPAAGGYSVIVANFMGATTSVVAQLVVDCGYALTPVTASFPAAGGSASIDVAAGVDCNWSPTTSDPWIQISGAGAAAFSFTVTSNASKLSRNGTIRVGDKTLAVIQYGADTVLPATTITAPLANYTTTGAVVTVKGVSSDNTELALVEYSIGGGPMQAVTVPPGTSRKLWYWSAATGLAPGTNVVLAQSTDLSGNKSALSIRKYFRVVKQPLTLVTNGAGGTSLRTGTLLNIGQGYSITATPRTGQVFSNWTSGGEIVGTTSTLRFLMETGLVLQANFVPNPFPAVSGTYSGLFYEPAGAKHEHSGAFSFTLASSGTYSGRLSSGPSTVLFTGRLNLDGGATNRVKVGSNYLSVEWILDLSPTRADRLVGSVRGADWVAELGGARPWFNTITNPSPFAGAYTLAVTGVTDSAISLMGSGFASATATRGGSFSLAGALADNTSVTFAGSVSKAGAVPVYLRLYGGRGSLFGWLAVRGTNFVPALESDLNWFRPAGVALPAGKLYPAGFANRSRLVGSVYRAPVPNKRRVVDIENGLGQVTFDGGSLVSPLTFVNLVTLSTNNLVRNDPTNPNKLTMTISTASGLFSGSAQVPGSTKLLSFRGAVLPELDSGLGFFVVTNETGGIRFEARP